MKNVLIALLIGIIVGVVGTWYFQQERESATAVKEAEKRAGEAATKAREALGQAAAGVKDAFAAKLEALELRAQDVRDDLARSGRVVRRAAREAGEGVADAARDAAITAEIKGKLAADPVLSARAIDVDTVGGRVTLSGTAPSHEAIGRATLLALETRGVREVVSTLQVAG
ncbi:MAG: BON domain-containing protein [Betaproteobacteria bacterium]|nr:BON domain-containing protein [Betaproteobacteria bacterium]MDH5578679.1 BON domain-containing protein [Betaproteobacteria bacterium]